MTVWSHLPTVFRRRFVLAAAGIVALYIAFFTTLLFVHPAFAAAGINKTLSFQGRLVSSTGAIVPDGSYNIQFHLYQDGTGTSQGNPGGTLKWTETYTNNGSNSGVQVRNGYFSVNLGSKNPFGTSVDWNQDTLWLSMNVAGTTAGCSDFDESPCAPDGEMIPMKRINAVPYAMNAGTVGGKSADDLIHNGTSSQTANFNISGTGRANSLQGNTSIISPLFDSDNTGTLNVGTVTASTINIGTSDSSAQTINIGTGAATKDITIGSVSGGSSTTLQGGTGGVYVDSNGGFIVHNSSQNIDTLVMSNFGSVDLNLSSLQAFNVNDSSSASLLSVADDGTISTGASTNLEVGGTATFQNGIDLQNGVVSSTGNTLSLQGNSLDLLTATNNGGVANIGIGNNATSGYALDVTGDTNTSTQYRINGSTALTSSALNFSGGSASSVNAASGQSLNLSSDTSVSVKVDGKASASFSDTTLQVGNGTSDSQTTVLTLDQASSAPSGSAVGSMYYDSTIGKVQCYEADGWGACSNSPDSFVTLSPEYANAVMNGADVGVISSDLCSDTLNINTSVCGTNETYNFYKWTSDQTSDQTRSIYVSYQLPSTFKNFVAGSTSLMGRTDSADSTVSYRIYRDHGSGLTACGSLVTASTGSQTSWQKSTASGSNDPSNCSFSAGDSLLVKINLVAKSDANAYVSNLNFAFSNN
ncbi:MAG TPA: hypothetical protein VGE34_03855 [Candidatus Saccharimonadales bacterium]